MKRIFFFALLSFLFAGCMKGDNTTSCTYDECRTVAPASEIQSVQNYVTANGIAATQHCSGMFYVIDQQGGGKKPSVCNTVIVNYEGRLTNGSVFDSTPAGSPASFSLSGVITGFKTECRL